jgi:hypothetical protein
MVLLTISQPAFAWWPDILNPVTWYEEAVDYFSDNVKGVLQLTWDVITLDPEDAWEDIKDIASNQVCFGRLTVLGLAISAGLEADFDECDFPPQAIEPDILAKLSLYFNSDFNSVRIHKGCNLDADLVPGNEAPNRNAITFGEQIYFKPDKYHPRDPHGFARLAHELTHVLQYRKKGFSDFICDYGLKCWFGANKSCAIEHQAYEYDELVEKDQNEDGDGIFTPLDNCPNRYNPGQKDFDGDGIGNACDEGWTSDPHRPMEFRRYGDFNGDGKADILVQSGWGIGILTYDGVSLTSLMLAPTGTSFGGWHYNSVDDQVVAIADFNRDGKADLLITGPQGIGILTYDGVSLTSLMVAPTETWFGGWRFQSGANRIVGTADFSGDGRQDIVITSGWGIGILTYDGSSLTSLMVAPNETWFGGWRFQSSRNSIEGFGDFNADGKEDILIRSAWGMGILTLHDATLTSLMVAPHGTKFGRWTFNAKTDRIAGIGRFGRGLADEILIISDSGLAILGRETWDASQLTTVATASNGTRLGGWLLDTRANSIFGIGYVNDSFFRDAIMIRSAWGIGMLTLDGSTLTTSMLAPNGTRFGGWLYNSAADQILGVGAFAGGFTHEILTSSKWGIGILSLRSSTLQSLMLAPNGTRFGGWLFDSTANQVGIDDDVIHADFRKLGY